MNLISMLKVERSQKGGRCPICKVDLVGPFRVLKGCTEETLLMMCRLDHCDYAQRVRWISRC